MACDASACEPPREVVRSSPTHPHCCRAHGCGFLWVRRCMHSPRTRPARDNRQPAVATGALGASARRARHGEGEAGHASQTAKKECALKRRKMPAKPILTPEQKATDAAEKARRDALRKPLNTEINAILTNPRYVQDQSVGPQSSVRQA